jgi:hypothetical protein
MKFWEVDLVLTDRLIKLADEWHKAKFPKCRASLKINNMCNHYKWFLDGCRCLGLIASENEAHFCLNLNENNVEYVVPGHGKLKIVENMTREETEALRKQAVSDVEAKLIEEQQKVD